MEFVAGPLRDDAGKVRRSALRDERAAKATAKVSGIAGTGAIFPFCSGRATPAAVQVWAYCLMPNHVHLILCPTDEAGMAAALGAGHRRWANFVNARGRWRGHLFDGRYASVVMDEAHLMAAVRYVALNPVRARLVARAADWPWSSVRAHLTGRDDGLVAVAPVLQREPDFAQLLATDPEDPVFAALRAAETTGRPLANPEFIAGLERILGRPIARRAPGRKPTAGHDQQTLL